MVGIFYIYFRVIQIAVGYYYHTVALPIHAAERIFNGHLNILNVRIITIMLLPPVFIIIKLIKTNLNHNNNNHIVVVATAAADIIIIIIIIITY